MYDMDDVIEERVGTGDVIRYVHGPEIDNVLMRTTNGMNNATSWRSSPP